MVAVLAVSVILRACGCCMLLRVVDCSGRTGCLCALVDAPPLLPRNLSHEYLEDVAAACREIVTCTL